MKKLSYTLKQKKIIAILMCINFFALVVNLLGIKGNITSGSGADKTIFNIFTHSKGFQYRILNMFDDVRFADNYEEFWPFVEFTKSHNLAGYLFKGIFCYFDFSEFIIYSILIFGIPLLIKLFMQK